MFKKTLIFAGMALSGAVCAHAAINAYCAENPQACVAAAPEIDPGSAMAALTLLAGGLAVARGRFRRK